MIIQLLQASSNATIPTVMHQLTARRAVAHRQLSFLLRPATLSSQRSMDRVIDATLSVSVSVA